MVANNKGPLDESDERYKLLKETQVNKDAQQVPEEYQRLVEPHVASFDYFLGEGIDLVVQSLEPVEVCCDLDCAAICKLQLTTQAPRVVCRSPESRATRMKPPASHAAHLPGPRGVHGTCTTRGRTTRHRYPQAHLAAAATLSPPAMNVHSVVPTYGTSVCAPPSPTHVYALPAGHSPADG